LKQDLIALLQQAVIQLQSQGVLPANLDISFEVERTRQPEHGDFASNIALALAKIAGIKPRALAQKIVQALPPSNQIAKVEIAGPGFINFFTSTAGLHAVIPEILKAKDHYGETNLGKGERIIVEFVSANPNGPLHVGHGRGAAYGDSLARLLTAAGYRVHKEYYINDAGRQMDILAVSVWLRYLELCGETPAFPVNAYQGDYVRDIARALHRQQGKRLHQAAEAVFRGLPADETSDGAGDKEAYIDALIERAKSLLGPADYRLIHGLGLNAMLDNIRQDLREFGVLYDEWFSEQALIAKGAVEAAVALLKKMGHLYEKDGARWFRASSLGDEKDRVVVRENGVTTYFASDIAYHLNKIERGFKRSIDVWGADHHGYAPRVRAALAALGHDPQALTVLLVQFAILYRGGERVQMSTRSGQFVTLRELREEVGNDAARFFYVLRKSEQHMDFDLDLAKSQSNENPVFYIQYAHARICSVFRQLKEKGLKWSQDLPDIDLELLREAHETNLINTLTRYPEMLEEAAKNHEPHQVAYYLRDLANDLHTYYNAHPFILAETGLRNARLALIVATRQVIANGLRLLGVSAPESM
jgi:arginyl-tRNA synthetase